MKVLDILTAPWAIEPDKLREMQEIYSTHLRGEKIDLEAIEARLGRPLASEQQEYSIRQGGIAVLAIDGVIAPKANMFTRVSGGTSAQMLQQQLESAMADSRVNGIVLAIDSPGGSVNGSPELAAAVREFAAEKPIVAVGEARMASAAYWIASAANAIYVTGPTVQVGSIGVVATHDYEPNSRSRKTEITAGRYKRIASENGPLTVEGQAYLQEQVDHIYSVFVDAVAANRGADADAVMEHMADGRVFIGQQAIDKGLVDGVATVDQLVSQMAADPKQFATRRKARIKAASPPKSDAAGAAAEDDPVAAQAAASTPPSGDPMSDPKTGLTRESFQAENPDLYTQILAAGAEAERTRVTAVRAQLVPGHEALIEKMAADGTSSGADAAMAMVAAVKSSLSAAAAAHAAEAPAPAKPSAAAANDDTTGQLSKADQVTKAKAYAAEHKVDFVTALKALKFAA